MGIQLKKRLLSVEDYHLMYDAGILSEEDKLELIHGELIQKSPIGSRHALVVNRLNLLLVPKIQEPYFLSVQNPIQLSDFSEPEPDLAIIKGPMDRFEQEHLKANDTALLIEVSDTTLEKDQEVKLPLYAEAGIIECWIINIEKKEIEVHSKADQSSYTERRIFRKGAEISVEALGLKVGVDQVFP